MVDATSLNQVGLTSFVSGLSGNNFTNIIKAEYQKDISAAAPYQRQLNEQTQKLTRYKQMAELLKGVQDIAAKLTDNTFSTRTAVINAPGGVDASKLVKVSVSGEAPLGKMSLKVLQAATSHKIASQSHVSDTAPLGLNGTFHLKAGSSSGADITFSNTMTLQDAAKAINQKSGESGVVATVVKVGDGAFKLVLSALQTNQPISLINKTGTPAQTLGILNASNGFVSVLNTAQPAKIEINGLEVQRNENAFHDVLPGVKIDLLRGDSGTNLSVDIQTNKESIKKEIQAFVESYNKFRQFALSQQATIGGAGAAPGAHLFADSVLKNVTDTVFRQLTASTEFKGQPVGLRSFGLSFEKDNTIKIDETKLNDALSNNLDGLKAFFAQTGTPKGLGQRLKDSLKEWNGSADSVIDRELKILDQGILESRNDINQITKQAEKRRSDLITRYARLEQQIAASKLIIRQLEAISKVRSENS